MQLCACLTNARTVVHAERVMVIPVLFCQAAKTRSEAMMDASQQKRLVVSCQPVRVMIYLDRDWNELSIVL